MSYELTKEVSYLIENEDREIVYLSEGEARRLRDELTDLLGPEQLSTATPTNGCSVGNSDPWDLSDVCRKW